MQNPTYSMLYNLSECALAQTQNTTSVALFCKWCRKNQYGKWLFSVLLTGLFGFQTYWLLAAKENKSLSSWVKPDGQSEIKEDINCLLKEHESIYFDKDQICFRWTFWPFQNSFSPHVKPLYFCLSRCNDQTSHDPLFLRSFSNTIEELWQC